MNITSKVFPDILSLKYNFTLDIPSPKVISSTFISSPLDAGSTILSKIIIGSTAVLGDLISILFKVSESSSDQAVSYTHLTLPTTPYV